MRTWKTADGAFSVEAKLIRKKRDSVVLERTDGKRVTVKLELLCDADKDYVASPPKITDKPPETLRRARRRDRGEMEYNGATILRINKEIPWRPIEPVARSFPKTAARTTFPIEQGASFRWASRLICDPSGSKLMFVWLTNREQMVRVFDLPSGQQAGRDVTMNKALVPAAISSDLTSLTAKLRGVSDTISWMTAKGGQIQQVLHWKISQAGEGLAFSQYIGDGLLVTADSEGVISLWDLHARALVWFIQGAKGYRPAISHDQGTLVCCNGKFLFQVDLRKSEVVGCVPMDKKAYHLHFSPAGDELICFEPKTLHRLDVANTDVIDSWGVGPNGFRGRLLGWVDDMQFIIPQTLDSGDPALAVVDLNTRGPIARYRVAPVGETLAIDGMGRVWTVLQDGNGYVVEGNKLPHKTTLEWVEQQNRDDLVLLGPGDSIKLEINAVVHDATSQQLETLKDIYSKVVEQDQRKRKRNSSGRGLDSLRDQLAKAMKGVQLADFDAKNEAREIVVQKLNSLGYSVVEDAEYTLHVDIGHPHEILTPDDIERSIPKGLPYMLKWQARLTDKSGGVIWKSASRVFSELTSEGETSTIPTTAPAGVNYLKNLTIPEVFISQREIPTYEIKAGEIKVKKK